MLHVRSGDQQIDSETGGGWWRGVPRTAPLAFVGATVFVSGLFVLASAGTRFALPVYGWIALMAALLCLPVGMVGLVAAVVETAIGRAGLGGWRRLEDARRNRRGTLRRGVRYAGWLWLSNGLALWLATIASQFGG